MNTCPCQSGRSLEDCCNPVIAGVVPAATAEALMRARYTAFVTQQIGDFVRDTLAEEKRAEFDKREVERSSKETSGLGFEVRSVTGGGAEDETGTVEYIARFRTRGQVQAHHELASFRRGEQGWLYVDGEVNPKTAPRQVDKVGRNDPCPCGSGQKYKKCCGK